VTALLDGRSNKADTLPTFEGTSPLLRANLVGSRRGSRRAGAAELGICLEQDLRVSRAKHSRFHERKQPRSRASQRSMSLDEL
jgi:hypothetical protein